MGSCGLYTAKGSLFHCTIWMISSCWAQQTPNSSQRHPPTRRTIIKRDLLSLIGLLNHAASVVRPGRTFLRSLIDASMTVERLDHRITLSAQARADIVWCHTFVREWNGISNIAPTEPTHLIYSDASGSWGCGAYWLNHWFQIEWESSWHIAAKELVPIVVAAAIWGRHWRGSRICCYCDNSAVVFAINKGSAQDPQLMRLLCSLFFFSAAHNFTISACHIAGSRNSLADALSRNNAPLFCSLHRRSHPQSPKNSCNWCWIAASTGPHRIGPSCLWLPGELCCILHTLILRFSPTLLCRLLQASSYTRPLPSQGGYAMQICSLPQQAISETLHDQGLFVSAPLRPDTQGSEGPIPAEANASPGICANRYKTIPS